MTKEDAAALLNGFEYPAREIETHAKALKEAGLVAVFGMSDDLMEFRGAIYDEVGAYDSTRVLIDSEGLIPTFDAVSDEGDEEMMAAYFRRKPNGVAVEAIWSPDDLEASWLIRTEIPHATFDILEDGDLFCRGVVFALATQPEPALTSNHAGEVRGEWREIKQDAMRKGLRRSPKYYPAIGETCRMSAPNCDDADGYTWVEVEVLWRDDLFVVTRTPKCWPTVTKLELALFEGRSA